MGILDFLSGQFIDVIAWTDDTRDTMVWRFERFGHEIKYGAKLTVREGQAAVFIHEGQLADVFGPGLYMLETNNMPIMTTLQHWDHGVQSPFKSEVYFVNTTRFNDQKWGTKNPIMARDPEFGPVRLRAFGNYTLRAIDPKALLKELVGTDQIFDSDQISELLRSVIAASFADVIGDKARDPGIAGDRHDRQREGAAMPVRDIVGGLLHAAYMFEQDLAVMGEPIALLAADEKRTAEHPFEREHAAADGGGAETGSERCAGKAAFGGDMQEELEVIPGGLGHRHISSLSDDIGIALRKVDGSRSCMDEMHLSPARLQSPVHGH